MILSANILTLLCRQYAHEIANSLFYTSLQAWASMRGLPGTAGYFRAQAIGERAHADMVLDYIDSRNEQLQIMPIDMSGIDHSPSSFVDVFVAAQERERATTASIAEIKAQADAEHDMMTSAWLSLPTGLIMEQVEEESSIQSILDRITARRGLLPLSFSDFADMAEMPGEVIHDIDTWIQAKA